MSALAKAKAPLEPRYPPGWDERRASLVANTHCNVCVGTGLRLGRYGHFVVCNCVWREIFRRCFNKWKSVVRAQAGGRTYTCYGGGRRLWRWSRPDEEYQADFELIARRTLLANYNELHFRIFRMHFIDGLPWSACCRKLGVDRGNFFHSVYRIKQALGESYAQTLPYGVYPVFDYLASVGPGAQTFAERVDRAAAIPHGAAFVTRPPAIREAGYFRG